MKFLTIILISIAFVSADAKMFYKVEKVKQFLKKDKTCEFAIGQIFDKKKQQIWADVLCVGTMVFFKGTINQVKGCSLFYYDVNTIKVKRLHSSAGDHLGKIPIVKNVDCKKGGFQKLLKEKAQQISSGVWSDKLNKVTGEKWVTVADLLRYGSKNENLEKRRPGSQVLLKSTESVFKKWWNSKK